MRANKVEFYDCGNKFWQLDSLQTADEFVPIEYVDGFRFLSLSENALADIKMNPVKELSVAEIEKILGYKVKIVKE